MFNILLQLETAGGLSSFLPIILIIFVFYFFMIRPQVNRQKSEDKFRSEIKKNDKIVTIGGIHGKVNQIKENKVIIEIEGNVRITIDKNCISKERSLNKT
ncbi:MAG: preprotein translocase subunit YajC [Flavobacteriales bacterium]|nr:preprotein translocase subunit YajC [Flavobacteriales bacterium]|tara:strand:+ start:25009 stop:25308 length:300 start_codon:yes stop_codon:yes gene_type:complete